MESSVYFCDNEFEEGSDLAEYVHVVTKQFQEQLFKEWDAIGIDEEVRRDRTKTVIDYIKSTYSDMLAETRNEKKDLLFAIEKLLEKSNSLEKQLGFNIILEEDPCLPFLLIENRLKTKIDRYEKIWNERRIEIIELLNQEEKICGLLGRKQKLLNTEPLPTQEEINDFKSYLIELTNEKSKREETFLTLKSKITQIINEIKIQPTLELQKIINAENCKFQVTDENMKRMENFLEDLKNQRDRLNTDINDFREKLILLWDRLELEPQKRNEFLEKYSDFTHATYCALKIEIRKCNSKIRENIKTYILKMRQEITDWWDKCCYAENERNYIYFNCDCYTEDLLNFHEMEIEKLKNYYESNKQIFELVSKREQLWNKMLDLERRANEPNRFKNRGGQLLKEEKERNSVRAQLPKIEHEILSLANVYEIEKGVPFTINGELIKKKIANDWEMHKENRVIKLSAKKQAREQITPAKFSKHVTNFSRAVTPCQVSPTKRFARQLFGTLSGKKNRTEKNIPKIQVNGSTIRRVSLERERRLEKRRRSRAKNQNKSNSIDITDYESFQTKLEQAPSCRSTLFELSRNKNLAAGSSTPKTKRIASRRNLMRSPSPLNTPRHTSVRGKLPIII